MFRAREFRRLVSVAAISAAGSLSAIASTPDGPCWPPYPSPIPDLMWIDDTGAQLFSATGDALTDFFGTAGRPGFAADTSGIAITDADTVTAIFENADGIASLTTSLGPNPVANVAQGHILLYTELETHFFLTMDGVVLGELPTAGPPQSLALADRWLTADAATTRLVSHEGLILHETPNGGETSITPLGPDHALVIDDDSVEIYDRNGVQFSGDWGLPPTETITGGGKTAISGFRGVMVFDADGNLIVERVFDGDPAASQVILNENEIIIVVNGIAYYYDCEGNLVDALPVGENTTVRASVGGNRVMVVVEGNFTYVDILRPDGTLLKRLWHFDPDGDAADVRVDYGRIIVNEWNDDDADEEGFIWVYDENGDVVIGRSTAGCGEYLECCDHMILIDDDGVRVHDENGPPIHTQPTPDDRASVVCVEGHIAIVQDGLVTLIDCETGEVVASISTFGVANVSSLNGIITIINDSGISIYDPNGNDGKDESGIPVIGTLPGGSNVAAHFVQIRADGVYGDMNCDGYGNLSDIGPFVLALTNPAAYAAQFPGCNIANGDINGDGIVSVSDIGPFVNLLVTP